MAVVGLQLLEREVNIDVEVWKAAVTLINVRPIERDERYSNRVKSNQIR